MNRRLLAFLGLLLVLAISGCGEKRVAVVWNTDEGEAFLGFIDVDEPDAFTHPPVQIGHDSTLAAHDGVVYVLSQSEGIISVVDPATATIEDELDLGEDSEPLSMAVLDNNTAYVTRRLATSLLRINLANGETEGIVDLSLFADSDGVPDLGTLLIHEGRLFVQIRRENAELVSRFEPPAYIAVIHLETESLIDADPILEGIQAIELEGTSPKQRMQVLPETNQLFVSATGGFFDEGGIEVVDLDTLQSTGLVIREADGLTGADLGAFVMINPERGYLVFSTDLDLSSHLLPFSLEDGVEQRPEMHVSVGYFVPSMVIVPGKSQLFAPDGQFAARGIYRFSTRTDEPIDETPVETDGQPTDMLLVEIVRD